MVSRTVFPCDAECPNVTRTHQTKGAMQSCKERREQGGRKRSSALTPSPTERVAGTEITVRAGKDFSGATVREDLAEQALWRPNFSGATLAMEPSQIEGAHLPGADFRGVVCDEFVDGVPLYMMSEARGAIVDQEIVDDALVGDHAWLLSSPEETPKTREGRIAAEFAAPFIQWSFSDTQWERLMMEGYDPEELVEAAQEFPPRNEVGFKFFMDSGDVMETETAHPHRRAWGDRELTLPPSSNARSVHEGSLRARL